MRSKIFWVLVAAASSLPGHSEPWMASRYAQNCASCHAPGRVNVLPKERRCSLSCQGCHTNPNGGGLRNFYGKWTQERWLNSIYLPGYKLNKPRPQPTDQQFYAEKRLQGYLNTMKDDEKKRVSSEGFRLRETLKVLPESEYDRRSTQETYVVPDLKQAQLRIPEDDPWRQRRLTYYNAGLDLRWFYLDFKLDEQHKKATGIMATDLAVSVEPVHRVNLVWESRFLSNPISNSIWDQHYTNAATVRSAYVLIDDIPYNTFLQAGIYRPLFGQYNPDHTTLFAEATGLDMRARFKAISVGTAPNVPFFNVHLIQAFSYDSGSERDKDKGFIVNAGARFVTLGAYAMLSYWNTSARNGTAGSDLKKNMTSLTGGLTWRDITVVADFTRIQRETIGGTQPAKDVGNSMTLEPRYRFFRENYIKASYETLNTAPNLTEGKATQMGFGLNSFPVSSLELELMTKTLSYTQAGVSHKENLLWLQTHFFF